MVPECEMYSLVIFFGDVVTVKIGINHEREGR
jgi:hypothetical protein